VNPVLSRFFIIRFWGGVTNHSQEAFEEAEQAVAGAGGAGSYHVEAFMFHIFAVFGKAETLVKLAGHGVGDVEVHFAKAGFVIGEVEEFLDDPAAEFMALVLGVDVDMEEGGGFFTDEAVELAASDEFACGVPDEERAAALGLEFFHEVLDAFGAAVVFDEFFAVGLVFDAVDEVDDFFEEVFIGDGDDVGGQAEFEAGKFGDDRPGFLEHVCCGCCRSRYRLRRLSGDALRHHLRLGKTKAADGVHENSPEL
jgi:hypothetical protein